MAFHVKRRAFLKWSGVVVSGLPAFQARADAASGYSGPIFDSHAHLISSDRVRYPAHSLIDEPIRESIFVDPITLERLIEQMNANGIDKACAVQRGRIYGYDNRYVTESAARYPDRLRAVIVVNPFDLATPALVRRAVSEDHVRGIRMMSNKKDETVDWIDSSNALEVWRAASELRVPMVVEFSPANFEEGSRRLLKVLDRVQDVAVVLDHFGLPPAVGAPDYGLGAAWKPFQERKNVYFKYSTVTAHGIPFAHIKGLADEGIDPSLFLRHAVDLYGADRVMWGSDVGQSSGSYAEMVALGRQIASRLTPKEQRKVLHDTGLKLFG